MDTRIQLDQQQRTKGTIGEFVVAPGMDFCVEKAIQESTLKFPNSFRADVHTQSERRERKCCFIMFWVASKAKRNLKPYFRRGSREGCSMKTELEGMLPNAFLFCPTLFAKCFV
jgi:hypothetical protein